jgi:protein-arginine kinase activator protein McsA
MTKIKISKKALYEKMLKDSVANEDYETAAKIRDALATIADDEIAEIDEETQEQSDENDYV